jgi:hypothetical protein
MALLAQNPAPNVSRHASISAFSPKIFFFTRKATHLYENNTSDPFRKPLKAIETHPKPSKPTRNPPKLASEPPPATRKPPHL